MISAMLFTKESLRLTIDSTSQEFWQLIEYYLQLYIFWQQIEFYLQLFIFWQLIEFYLQLLIKKKMQDLLISIQRSEFKQIIKLKHFILSLWFKDSRWLLEL